MFLVYKAKLFKKLSKNIVQCLACQRYCKIKLDNVGFCGTRLNKKGVLYSLTYGVLTGIQIDPIEKKPLYHFYPGSQVLSIGSYGCNYKCKQCLNYHCSWGKNAASILQQLKAQGSRLKAKIVSPASLVELTLNKGYPGIAFTYNEPSIYPEYVCDVAKLAKAKGLYTVYVTNGSWTKESLDYMGKYIDAVNIDIKGFYPKTYTKMGAFFGEVLKITQMVVKKYKIFTELTTLIIPGINDSNQELKALAGWIVKSLGPDIPWHLSRFDPNLAPIKEFKKIPATSVKTLKKAYEIGKKAGLKYVYVWAPAKNFGEELFSIGNTYCPKCGKLVIKRSAWQPEIIGVEKKGRKAICKFCKKELNLIF